MTPEEKAKEYFPSDIPIDASTLVKRAIFIEGANWMKEEKDKEIAELKDEILSLKVPFSTNPQINPPKP